MYVFLLQRQFTQVWVPRFIACSWHVHGGLTQARGEAVILYRTLSLMPQYRLTLALLAAAPLLAQSPFVEKPYLQLGNTPGAESLTLLWHAPDRDAAWNVEVRTSKDSKWRAVNAPSAQSVRAPGIDAHRVYRAQLSKLVAGEEFQYQVLKDGKAVFEATGRARKSANQAQHFVVMGDVAQNTPGQKAVAHQVSLAKPDFVFITGDIVYSSGRISEYREKFFPIYNADADSAEVGAPLLRSVPFIAAPGNHDTIPRNFERFPDALAYFLYWDQPLNGPPGSHTLIGNVDAQPAFLEAAKPRYPGMANFSFDYGNAHWTVLDSNTYMDWTNPALRAWLEADLAEASKATFRFVAFHHPGFNSSKTHLADQWMRLLSPVFEKNKVDIVFAGHVHNYQRSYPLTFVPMPQADGAVKGPKGEVAGEWKLDKQFGDGGGKAKAHGVIYLVTGAGGANLYNPEQTARKETWQEFTQVYQAQVNSFTSVEINGKKLKIRQVSADGKELDAFQLDK